MSDFCLKNDQVEIEVNFHGAELRAIKDVTTGRDYLWNADPAFWNRCSPVLFPFVGMVRDKKFRYDGKEYTMGQHGFARDMDFTLVSQTEDSIWFSLDSNEETLEKYPLPFHLEIGYQLVGRSVKVLWKVSNPAEDTLYFSIGAHPAFLSSVRAEDGNAFLLKDQKGQIVNTFINTIFGHDGLVTIKKEERITKDGVLVFDEHLFDNDALVVEDSQIGEVSILDKTGKPYITATFDAPVVGLWSPPKKCAPFVCIEPWYGRCDDETFTGDLSERKWTNKLDAGENFEAVYTITI